MVRTSLSTLSLLLLATSASAQQPEVLPDEAPSETKAVAPESPPAAPPAEAGTTAEASAEGTGWLRAGVGVGSFVLQQSSLSFAPGLSAIVEACPSDTFCLFGSLRGTVSGGAPMGGGVIGGTPLPFVPSTLASLSVNAGGRYVLSPGALVEVSPWLSLGVGGGYSDGNTITSYDPNTGEPLYSLNGLVATNLSATLGVMAEREMWDGIFVRVSTSLVGAGVALTHGWLDSDIANGTSDFRLNADLVLQPSFAVLMEL